MPSDLAGRKILFPVEIFYPSQAGGTANAVYWLAKALSRNGLKPVVIASDRGVPAEIPRDTWIDNEAGRVRFVTTASARLPITQIRLSRSEIASCDALHLSSVFYPAGLPTALRAASRGIPIVWSVRGELDADALKRTSRAKSAVLSVIKARLADKVTFHSTSPAETENIRRVLGERARLIEIPDYCEFESQMDRDAGDYLLFVGRLDPIKGIDLLIRAAADSEEFASRTTKIKIAGRGSEKYLGELRDLADELAIGDRVEFLGQVEGESKTRLFANAYFTVMPSHSENFGISIAESLAQGTPVIASQGTPWKLLEDDGAGFWVSNEPANLAAAIDRALLMPPDEYAAIRSRCRPTVVSRFEIDRHIDQWLDVYRGLF